MSRIVRLLTVRLTPESLDARFGQWVCFALAPALLFFAIKAIGRHASTLGEVVIGLLAAISASLLMVVVGLLLPLVSSRATMPAAAPAVAHGRNSSP